MSSDNAGGVVKSQYQQKFEEALNIAKVAVAASDFTSLFQPVLSAMENAASIEGGVSDGSGKCPSYGKKPLHSIWFGPPPSSEKAVDALAASLHAKVWSEGTKAYGKDPDVAVHFWCLPEWETHYRDYFAFIGSGVQVHSLNELVEDFPEIEKVSQLQPQLPKLPGLTLSQLRRRVGEAVTAYKTVVREKYRLFDPEYLPMLEGDKQRQYLQAALALIRDHLLDSDRRSKRDLVLLKNSFVNLLLVMVGGFYFDCTVIPTDLEELDDGLNKHILPDPMAFLPINEISRKGSSFRLRPDIFCLGMPLATAGSFIRSDSERSVRNMLVNDLWNQAVKFFSPTSELVGKYPVIDLQGEKVYSESDHYLLLASIIEPTLSALTLEGDLPQRSSEDLSDNQLLANHGFSGPGKVLCSKAIAIVPHLGHFCLGEVRFDKFFLQTHLGKLRSEGMKELGDEAFSLAFESDAKFLISQRLNYLKSVGKAEEGGGNSLLVKVDSLIVSAVETIVSVVETGVEKTIDEAVSRFAITIHTIMNMGVGYDHFLDLRTKGFITKKQWLFLMTIEDFAKRKQAFDFISEIGFPPRSSEQPTIFDDRQAFGAESKIRYELRQLLYTVQCSEGDLCDRIRAVLDYVQDCKSQLGKLSSLGATLAKIEAAFGGDQPRSTAKLSGGS